MRIGLVLASLLAVAPVARAQEHPIDRATALVDAGEYHDARAVLDRWWTETDGGTDDTPAELRARALLLRGRLAPDIEAAEPEYLALVLGYPTAPEAAEALLRLGQGLLAAGDAARAAAYLERLAADYPGNPHRTTGLLWLARARRALGRDGAACAAATAGLNADPDPELAALLRLEGESLCAPPRAAARRAPAPRPAPPAAQATDRAAPVEGRYAVQSGAFRDPAGAERLADRLRTAGFDPRLVYVSGSPLRRVRIGRFTDAAAANALAARIRAAGFAAIVVGDAAAERANR